MGGLGPLGASIFLIVLKLGKHIEVLILNSFRSWVYIFRFDA